jgi:hypothetical protein
LYLFAPFAVGGAVAVDSYDDWQWNGFTRSGWVPTVAVGSAAPTVYALLNNGTTVLSATADPSAVAVDDGTATLSGVVYVDENGDGIRDTSDWGIAGASVSISLVGGASPLAVAVTGRDGSYTFSGLASGDYLVSLLTPSSEPGQPSIGSLVSANGPVGTASGQDAITDILLGNGDTGVNYDFPQLVYPMQLISKRMLVDADPGVGHTAMPSPVPEPSSLAMLVMAGLFFSALRRRRRQ